MGPAGSSARSGFSCLVLGGAARVRVSSLTLCTQFGICSLAPQLADNVRAKVDK